MAVKVQPSAAATAASASGNIRETSGQGGYVPGGYTKPMEFHADGPGRVIVRLERLMGSDRIRITDPKYMGSLLSRLCSEEERTWRKRTRERRKAEHNRFRQLVIDGHAEPTSKMQDVYNHPVFKINRIIKRLEKLNYNEASGAKLPPILAVEPFKYDQTGGVFKHYPGHVSPHHSSPDKRTRKYSGIPVPVNTPEAVPPWAQDYNEFGGESQELSRMGEFGGRLSADRSRTTSAVSSTTPTGGHLKPNHISQGAAKLVQSSNARQETNLKDSQSQADAGNALTKRPIHEIQKLYGVAPHANLGSKWKPYSSPLLKPFLLNDKLEVTKLYKLGNAITKMYARQQTAVAEYVAELKPIVEERPGKGEFYEDFGRRTAESEATWPLEGESEKDEYFQSWLNDERRRSQETPNNWMGDEGEGGEVWIESSEQ